MIQKLYEQHGKIVILIDEYDKPIIDFLEKEELPQAKINQKVMKAFYSALKDSETYIKFLFITGVSKFSQVSIFSDLNHLTDLTLRADFSTITGYTQEELEANFEAVRVEQNMNRDTLLTAMKEWYNGFSWDGIHTLYNPYRSGKAAFGQFEKKNYAENTVLRAKNWSVSASILVILPVE